MKNKKFNFRKEVMDCYRESFEYIKSIKKFIFAIIFVFLFFSLIGFFVPATPEIQQAINEFIQKLMDLTANMSQSQLTSFIFLNNLQSSFFGMIFGILFGIYPIIATIVNGYLLGYVAKAAVNAESILSLWRLFPHGIFELPAVFISLGMGLKLGTFVLQKNKWKSLKSFLLSSLKTFFFVVLPLLIIAAFIEGALIFLAK